MQARYYDPVIGRFYSNDPIDAVSHLLKGNIHGFGRYTYGNNNPYKFTDPDGREALSGFDSFTKLFNSAETEAKNIASGLKETAKKTSKGLENAEEFTKNFTKDNLANGSTLAGLIPGGQVVSLALAGADLLVNGDSSSAAGAIAATSVDAAKSDPGAVKVTTTKAQAIKAVGNWAFGVIVSTGVAKANENVTEKMEIDKK